MTKEQPTQQSGSRIERNADIILHSILIVIVLLAGITGWVHWIVVQKTLIGMLVACVGGMTIGLAAQRFLANSRNTQEALLGMVVTTGIGVVTIGYLYIAYIKGPMKSIGTVDRTIEQSFIFLEFLIAQISGTRLGKVFKR